jgi:hypothetical protein
LLLAAGVGTVAIVVTARRCRLPRLLTVLLAEQLVLHAVLGASSPAGCPAMPTMADGHGAAMCTGLGAGDLAQTPHSISLAMVASHLVATVLTAWVLTRGEAALWRLADRIVDATRPPQTSWPVAAPHIRVVGSLPAAHVLLRGQDAAPRGPPSACAAAS